MSRGHESRLTTLRPSEGGDAISDRLRNVHGRASKGGAFGPWAEESKIIKIKIY